MLLKQLRMKDTRDRLRRVSAASTLFAAFAMTIVTPTVTSATPSHTLSPEPVMVAQAGLSRAAYVLWSQSCDRDRRGYTMTRSLDGGHTFSRVSAPPVTFNRNNPIGSIHQLNFANADDGLALINDTTTQSLLLYATFDGGRSWYRESNSSGQQFESITSTPSSFYAVETSCPKTVRFCQRFELDRTSASHLKWTTQSETPVGGHHNSNAPFVVAFGHDV